jgi:branched-chain amino acid transport system ATP-binding protein
MEESLLRVKEVGKHFGGLWAVNGASLDVASGSITALVGPNGSGKTTLFNVVFGLYKPDEGCVYFNGERIDHLAPHQVYAKGMVHAFQIPRLFYRLTVLDNMLLAARGHKGDGLLNSMVFRQGWQAQERELADKALELLNLLELDRLTLSPAGELSGGQRKLLEIGRALMAAPVLLLLDEPAAGVNPNLGRKIFERIEFFRQRGLSFFIIEHRLEILFDFADWVYVMDRGKIAVEGKPEEVAKDSTFYKVYLGD